MNGWNFGHLLAISESSIEKRAVQRRDGGLRRKDQHSL